jgi:hypothetical protein
MKVSVEIRFIRSTARHSLSDPERDEEIIRGPQIPQIAQFVEQHGPDWKEHVDNMTIPEQIVNRKEKKFRRNSETVEGLCFIISAMFFYVPNAGKVECNDDDDNDDDTYGNSCVRETRRAT